MRSYLPLMAVLPLTYGIRIVQTNQDGWAEANLRTFFDVLSSAGHQVVLSAPARAHRDTERYNRILEEVRDDCSHASCPPGSPPIGANATEPRLNYVNSLAENAISHGISVAGPNLWHGRKPELALSGPDSGSVLGMDQYFSPSEEAARFAVGNAKIPAITFFGATGSLTAWNAPTPLHSRIYADLAANITSRIIHSGKPFLPFNIYLHVNFPRVKRERCNQASQFKFVLTSDNLIIDDGSDVEWCGARVFPFETDVVRGRGDECFVAISPLNVYTGGLSTAVKREIIRKLRPMLSCLPDPGGLEIRDKVTP